MAWEEEQFSEMAELPTPFPGWGQHGITYNLMEYDLMVEPK
jgi:hypothetical protein